LQVDPATRRDLDVKATFLVALMCILSASEAVVAQTAPSLGSALYSRSYTTTVWVNSFDPAHPRFAHGVFSPSAPSSPTYDDRYGMTIIGSGTATEASNGQIDASGTAHNPFANTADGSILV
jgi:hypothetical protein